jgi:GrpB-like predicted nucleotidyltransferase (UPF0157 family)
MNQWQRSNRKNRSYKLEPYNPEWPEEFKLLEPKIAPLYGDNLVHFYHVGSTSVPGMLAKPQIDVCAVVKSLEKVKEVRSKFIELGYAAKGDYVGTGEEYFSYDSEAGERKYNIHTLQVGNPAIEGYLSFKEYLKAFPAAMNEYIAIKNKLRSKYGEDDFNSYDRGKDALIAKLKKDALVWYHKNLYHSN